MYRRSRWLMAVGVLALVVTGLPISSMAPAEASTDVTALYFFSESGDFIGQGKEVTLTEADVDFYAQTRSWDNSIEVRMTNFTRPPYVWWYSNFAAPHDAELAVGIYASATRYPFQDDWSPGLSFYGDGRGCNTSIGHFEVLEVAVSPSGVVERFAADFFQTCGSDPTNPGLHGAVRFNSTVPLPVLVSPEVDRLNSLNGEGCVEATGPDGAEVSFEATSVNSIPVDFTWDTSNGYSGNGALISFPVAVDANADLTVTITDPVSGDTAETTVSVCVSDTTAPTITILSPAQGETFNGANAHLEVVVTDLVDFGIDSYDVMVGETITGSLDHGEGSLGLFRKSKDGAIEMTVTVEAADHSGNTGKATVTIYLLHDNSG